VDPRPPRARLTASIIAALERRIADGGLPVGARLPTEARLAQEFAVSRTVVREAVAQLRARGLVEARQGVGVFVTEAPPAPPPLPGDVRSLPEILDLLEFRMTVEIDAAGLAASRHAPRQSGEIHAAHEHMIRLVQRGEAAVEADFAFHLAIAAATNNPVYAEVLRHLGSGAIPRSRLLPAPAERSAEYLQMVLAEHAAIVAAIEAGDAEAARAAMRHHLLGSQRRYRALLAAAASG
jgi:DNA-binding FadR family transcriptional regulator